MNGRKFHASCAPRNRLPASQPNNVANAVRESPLTLRSKPSSRRLAMTPAKAIAQTWARIMRLCPNAASTSEPSGGALYQMKRVIGLNPARMIDEIAKLMRMANDVCLNERPVPRICASIPLSTALAPQVRKIRAGNLIAV